MFSNKINIYSTERIVSLLETFNETLIGHSRESNLDIIVTGQVSDPRNHRDSPSFSFSKIDIVVSLVKVLAQCAIAIEIEVNK